jgi:hypothetical protein
MKSLLLAVRGALLVLLLALTAVPYSSAERLQPPLVVSLGSNSRLNLQHQRRASVLRKSPLELASKNDPIRGGAAVVAAQPSSSRMQTLKVGFYFGLWYLLNVFYNSTLFDIHAMCR